MITFSAFADEIDPDLDVQMEVCEANGVRCIDVRAIDGKSVAEMTVDEARQYKRRLDDRGFAVPCIGSPIGKIRMHEDFDSHLDLLKHCGEIAEALGTSRVRIFSFYPSPGRRITDQRDAVIERMRAMVEVADRDDLLLMHENEKSIYGAKPDRVRDLLTTIDSPRLKCIFDPANYVEEGVRPYNDGWRQGLDELTAYFHIKDKIPGQGTCVPAGQGEGQIPEIFTELRKRNFSGYMTLEPHMKAAGQFSGFSGADRFGQAASALRELCERQGLRHSAGE